MLMETAGQVTLLENEHKLQQHLWAIAGQYQDFHWTSMTKPGMPI